MKHRLVVALKLAGLLLFSYFLLRLFFLVSNLPSFSFISFSELLACFIGGLRFDIASISATNGLFFILFLLPVNIFYTRSYRAMLKLVFLLSNIPFFLFNFVDIAYFHFTQKRTTADFFNVAAMGDDFKNMIPSIVMDYWWVLAGFLLFCFLFYRSYQHFIMPAFSLQENNSVINSYWLVPATLAGLLVIGIRGGIQFKPLSILGAANYTRTQNVGLVLNSTFTLMKTWGKEELVEFPMPAGIRASDYFDPVQFYGTASSTFNPKNIVVIIMESFGKEYIGYFNHQKGYTPFLDSLLEKSLVCTDAFANGKKSIEGIPAVVAGLPALMNNSYIGSVYNANKLTSLPELLKKYGYQSAFFHGGNNGTMGFESFSQMAGYDRYIGRNEYPSKEDYDGTWGIFDGPFFKFYADQMSAMKEPFMTTFFSLSSHHPYTIPENLASEFVNGEQPIHKAVRYADYSLQQFFTYASAQPWYKNTLFVITADHTGPSIQPAYQTRSGIYAIPILYFCPSDTLQGTYEKTTQQTDIIPSVLHYLHFPDTFKVFGTSIFDSTKSHWAISYLEGMYQLINNDFIIDFDGEKIKSVVKRNKEGINSLDKGHEDLTALEKDSTANLLRVVISEFNYSMIHNKLTSH